MTISTKLAFIGSQAEVYITTHDGYYLQDVVVTDSFGKNVPIAKSAYPGGDKFGDCYSFTVPSANVTVTPKFSLIANTFDSDIAYNGDNLNLSYSNPVKDGKVYNELTGNFEPISNSGVIIAPIKALSKYGFNEKDLTYENIKKWKETGHHLAKCIVALDDDDVLDYTMGIQAINFDIEFTDVSINARRELDTCVVSYVNFKDDLGTVANAIRTSSVKKLDKHVYGDGLKETFQPHKGINYSGGGELGATTAFEKMKDIKDKGFDFIRLPLWVTVDENNQLRRENLVSYDKKIENALKLGMSVIVDLHHIYDIYGDVKISADYAGNVQKYYNCWEVLAKHYAAYPHSVIFQLVNEPRIDVPGPDPITIPEMMEMQEKLVDQIRAVPGNENRKIVIGSDVNYPLNMDRDFPDSLLNKGNIMIDFHYYTPMKFTHAGVGDDPAGVTLEETGVNFKSMESTIKSIVDFGKRKGVDVFMGEWGAVAPDYDDKLIYYTKMVELMGKHGLSWSVWGYTELYSGYVNGQWDETLLDIYFERAKYYQ